MRVGTTEQCRDKLKKMRLQYQKVQDAVRKSGSSTDEKNRFHGIMQWTAYSAKNQQVSLMLLSCNQSHHLW